MKISSLHITVSKFIAFTAIGLSLSCSNEPLETIQEVDIQASAIPTSTAPTTNSKLVKDQYIVVLSKKPAKADSRAEAALEALAKEVGNMANARMKGIYKSALTGFVAKLSPAQVAKLENDPRVVSVTADRYIQLEDVEETAATVQDYPVYGLDRIDQRDKLMDRAYSYTSTGSGVTTYVMDSGINYTHSEFGGRARLGVDLVRLYPDPEKDIDDPEVRDGGDCNGHGTHVAGTLGGNQYGVAKNVDLVSVRVFSCYGETTWSRILHAVDWITTNAVKPAVVNMSLGDIGVFADVQTAIKNSVESGIHYVVAAGNSKMNACEYSPAYVPEVLTVGASDIDNSIASFSNYGSCLDFYAPGVKIISAGIADNTATRIMSGTSMAAPHVAGIVALYLERNPAATPAEVHQALVVNSTPGMVSGVPSGTTNLVYSHFSPVAVTAPVQPDLAFNAISSKVRGSYRVDLSGSIPTNSRVLISRDGNLLFPSTTNVYSYLDYPDVRDATLVYKVCEELYKNCSEKVIVLGNGGETTEPVNSPPTADFSFSANLLDVQFTDMSTDSDGSISSWNWNFGDGTSSSLQHPQHTYLQGGTYEVSLVVTDDAGASHSTSKSLSISGEVSPPEGLVLTAVGSKNKGQWQTSLSWTPAGTSAKVDIYRNGQFIASSENNGSYEDVTNLKGSGTLSYKICESGTTICSNEVIVNF